jgi:hypothetical protein
MSAGCRRWLPFSTRGKFAVSASGPADSEDEGDDAVDREYAVVSKTQMYSFTTPLAGMFLWMRVHYSTHPLYTQVAHERLAHALWIFLTTAPYRVLVSPGGIFSPTDELRAEKGWQYFRLCFAAVDDEVLGQLSRAFVAGCRTFWAITTVREIDEILRDDDETPPLAHRRLEEALPDAWMLNLLLR